MGLITTDDVIKYTARENLDPRILETQFVICERKYVRKLLGDTLFEQLVSENDKKVYTGNNQTLLEGYIKPMLAYFVLYECIPALRAEITSNGINVQLTDSGAPADASDIGMLRQSLYSNAEVFQNAAIDYMCDNNISYNGEDTMNKSLPFLY